jgi:D-alanine-D-alanine ligase
MKKKLRVAILFGGKSAEHEISLISARNIFQAIDKKKYDLVAIGIDKDGRWFVDEEARLLRAETRPYVTEGTGYAAAILPGAQRRPLVEFPSGRLLGDIDAVFPVLHGPFGEDGTVQGLLKLANVPFVGAGVLGSAIGMDKDVTKRLLRDAKIPIGKFLTYEQSAAEQISFSKVRKVLGEPVFVKPANLGSSVGISKASHRTQFDAAIREAFRFDSKILIEEFIDGREIECSVLGDATPVASLPGEIITGHNFYSYDAKYLDANGARLVVPAELPRSLVKKIQQTAIETFKALCCQGMARVDFFLKSDRTILVNEINTIPGFTKISMYPKMWEASGLSYSELIDRLIELARQRFQQEQTLATSIDADTAQR